LAHIHANSAFDMSGIDLNWYKRNAVESASETGPTITFNGLNYNSSVYVQTPDEELDLLGMGLKFNARTGAVVGGTVTFIGVTIPNEWDMVDPLSPGILWWGEDLKISGTAIYKAFNTRATSDEKALLVKALAGADTFDLSADDDHAYGYNGNDSMNGNDGDDVLYGGNGNDALAGGIGNDVLRGDAGNDLINGGDGDDVLIGGAGRDTMEGGAGADQFVFDDKHSGKGALADHITDFEVGVDTIDLHLIDANTRARGDQAFRFSESGPARNAIWLVEQDGDTIIFADQNRDGKADLQIVLEGVTGVTASDFIL
jgi:Ca2+-binding RTX toxin-like protein